MQKSLRGFYCFDFLHDFQEMDFNRKVMVFSVSVLGLSLATFLLAYMVYGDDTDDDLRTLRQTNVIFFLQISINRFAARLFLHKTLQAFCHCLSHFTDYLPSWCKVSRSCLWERFSPARCSKFWPRKFIASWNRPDVQLGQELETSLLEASS